MSTLTEILDRLTNIQALRVQVDTLIREQGEARQIMLRQQNELAEIRGQLKALIQMQSQSSKEKKV
ncbi:MAG: hypothetical protein EAZ30_02690 [Betaproteobacteria bacterium]|jgi:hypothetical protein|nr:MAG: hypothetical protein EAZ30_02690 [Betaproteobacteria bacterium]